MILERIRISAVTIFLLFFAPCTSKADAANLDLNSSLKQIIAANQKRYKQIDSLAAKISISNRLTSAVHLGPGNVSEYSSSLAYVFSGSCYRIDCNFGNPSNTKDSYVTMAYDGTTYNYLDNETQMLSIAKGDKYFKCDPRITAHDALTLPFTFLNNDPGASFIRFPMLGLDQLWELDKLNAKCEGVHQFNGETCLVFQFDNRLTYFDEDIKTSICKIEVYFSIHKSLFPIYWIRKSGNMIIETYEVKAFETMLIKGQRVMFPSLGEDILYTSDGKPRNIKTLRLDSLQINTDLKTDFQVDPSQARTIWDMTTGKGKFILVPQ